MKDDHNYVVNTWLKNYKANGVETRYLTHSIYKDLYFEKIKAEVENSNVNMIGDYGFVVWEPMVLDHIEARYSGEKRIIKYIYIKKRYRGDWYAKDVVEKMAHGDYVFCSYLTSDFAAMVKKLGYKLMYMPYLQRE